MTNNLELLIINIIIIIVDDYSSIFLLLHDRSLKTFCIKQMRICFVHKSKTLNKYDYNDTQSVVEIVVVISINTSTFSFIRIMLFNKLFILFNTS